MGVRLPGGALRRKVIFAAANVPAEPGEGALDATEPDRLETAETRPRPRDARAQAAAYLDLWERHVGQTAVHGPPPGPAPARAEVGTGAGSGA